MGYIKELYYGNVSPGEQSTVQNSEYSKLAGSCDELYRELKKMLSEDGAEKLDKFSDKNYALTDLAAEENYILGFRDGAKLMLDVLTGVNDNLQPLINE